jgi:hypothetical protein
VDVATTLSTTTKWVIPRTTSSGTAQAKDAACPLPSSLSPGIWATPALPSRVGCSRAVQCQARQTCSRPTCSPACPCRRRPNTTTPLQWGRSINKYSTLPLRHQCQKPPSRNPNITRRNFNTQLAQRTLLVTTGVDHCVTHFKKPTIRIPYQSLSTLPTMSTFLHQARQSCLKCLWQTPSIHQQSPSQSTFRPQVANLSNC